MSVANLKVRAELWNNRNIKVVRSSFRSRLRVGPELILMILWSNERGDHGEDSLEWSVSSSSDEQLVGESCSIAGASNVYIVHISSWYLLTNLSNQIQYELNIISFAFLIVDIPAPLIAIRSYNDAGISKEVTKGCCVTLPTIT